jgi:putative transposase
VLADVRYFHQRQGLVGHLEQGRFQSPAVQRQGYWLSCGRYVERNPVEARLVALPWDYAWSSARAYALGEANPLLADNPEYLALAPGAERRQRLWRALLRGADPKEEVVRRGDWALGSARFKARLLVSQGRPAPRRRGRPRKPRADDETITSQVSI